MNKKVFLGLLLASAVTPVTQSVGMSHDQLVGLVLMSNRIVLDQVHGRIQASNPGLASGIKVASDFLEGYRIGRDFKYLCPMIMAISNRDVSFFQISYTCYCAYAFIKDMRGLVGDLHRSGYSLSSKLLGCTIGLIGSGYASRFGKLLGGAVSIS